MGDRPAVPARATEAWAQAHDGPAQGSERLALSGSFGRRLADAAQRLSTMADGLLVVPALYAPPAVPHDPRRGADARPEREEREQSPSAAMVDSQSVKAPSAPSGGGYDAGKRIKGRKRHIAVDTDGRLLMVNLTTADISDSAGAQEIITAIRRRWPWLKHLFGDGAYDRTKLLDAAALRDFTVEIIRRSDDVSGFHVLPRRWVVERTFGWMTRWRRLVRDYEKRLDVSEAMIHLAMASNLLRRLTC